MVEVRTSLAALAALMMSVLFGLVYLMSVVGHVQRDRNYDVYTVRLQLLAAVQILAFLAAVLAMSKIVYDRVTLEETDRLRTSIGITVGAKTVEYDVPSGASVSIKVFGDDEVELTVLPKP